MIEWWIHLTALERVFVGLAIPFSLFTLFQLLLELVGVGGDHGLDDGGVGHGVDLSALGHDMGGFFDHFTFFSVRNLIYFLMMFGWTGLASSKSGAPTWLSILVAIVAGLLTTIIIGWIFYMFSKLTESGNIRISSAIGQIGTVYIQIPEKRSGMGVIQLVMQGVTQERNAMTDGEALQTGVTVMVSDVIGGNILLVNRPEVENPI